MIPVLLNLPYLKIYTFGIFLVLAFFWGSFLLWRNIRLTAYKEDDMFDGLFLSLIGALFFGRLVYVALNFGDFGFNFLKFLLINGYPGLSLYGALLGGAVTLFFYLRSKKVEFLSVVDGWVSPLLVALAVGKLGSFFSGVEVGAKTGFLLSLKYPGYDGSRHLTALYEALFLFIGALLAYKIVTEVRRERLGHGVSLAFFFWWFSADYFLFDKLKNNQLYLADVSFNMALGGVFLLTLSLFFLYYFRVSFFSKLGRIRKSFPNYGTFGRHTQKTKKDS